jgi:hypothetical protein
MDYGTALNGPEYRLFKQGEKNALSNVTATGYFVYLEQFKALCPEKYAQAMLSLANRPKFIDRWYADGNKKVCNADEGTAEGLLTYKEREFVAIDTVCKFTGIRAAGGRYDISMRCASEGEDSPGRETLEVQQGKLQRTVVNGRKAVTFTYDRCPF